MLGIHFFLIGTYQILNHRFHHSHVDCRRRALILFPFPLTLEFIVIDLSVSTWWVRTDETRSAYFTLLSLNKKLFKLSQLIVFTTNSCWRNSPAFLCLWGREAEGCRARFSTFSARIPTVFSERHFYTGCSSLKYMIFEQINADYRHLLPFLLKDHHLWAAFSKVKSKTQSKRRKKHPI